MGRDKRLGDRRGFHEVEAGRDGHRHPLVGQNILGLPPAGHDAEDAVARLERADDVGPQGIDFAGVFQARDIGRCAGGAGYIPRACSRSARFKPQARTRTRTWSPRGSGVGTSRIFRTSGPPVPVITMAFMGTSSQEGTNSQLRLLNGSLGEVLDRQSGTIQRVALGCTGSPRAMVSLASPSRNRIG